jgi:hypothetical protein
MPAACSGNICGRGATAREGIPDQNHGGQSPPYGGPFGAECVGVHSVHSGSHQRKRLSSLRMKFAGDQISPLIAPSRH